MRVLLDTHAFLWLDADRQKLSKTAIEVFENLDNEVYLSVVSLWEIQIKAQRGNLTLRVPLPELVRTQTATNSLPLLPLKPEHIYAMSELPDHHKDPFDRILLAQAKVEGLALMSNDSLLAPYGVKLTW